MTDDSARDFAFLTALAADAAAAALPHFRVGIAADNKAGPGAYDPVTEGDRATEAAIRARIEAAFPDDAIIGEEFGTARAGARHTWIVDPIDGTRAFLAGLPLWGTLVGLVEDDRAVLGMMSQPFTGEMFLGDGGRAEWRRGGAVLPLAARSGRRLGEALMMSTSPHLFAGADAAVFARMVGAVRDIRYGGDCYAYCMLAAGQVDLVVECGLKTYDIAALVPIIEGAGGVVTTWDGRPAKDGGRIVAAGSAALHAEALALLNA
ncbi:histidinol-phosphatase [Pseudoxanthobacter sp.]|uniref:histidinol-phosphatase n=1 Tax=Pseudoxanthobacter sp. TaxID=1925742 RepID=UPI002FE17439